MKLNELKENLLNRFKELTPLQKIALAAVFSILISVAIVSILWVRSPEYGLLYSNLSPSDTAQIIKKLKEMRIPYKLKEGGAIYVPLEKVYETRVKMASMGLPKGKEVGFEIFDKTSFGTSDFVQRINYIRALQGELERTIESLDAVEWARVHIAMPKESLFISKEKEPSASVVLKIKPNYALTQDEIQGIVYLVASSVPRLSTKRVVVVDSEGHVLAGAKKNKLFTGNQIRIKDEIEEELENKIVSLLEKVTGKGKVIAKVSVDMDFSEVNKTVESYDPYNVAVRSEQITQKQSSGTQPLPMGVPGVLSNIPNTVSGTSTRISQKNSQKESSKVVNYEIGKTVESVKEAVGRIVRVSAAVLVDGKYSASQLEKLKQLVQKAIGYSKQRGDQIEIVNMPFKSIQVSSHENGLMRLFKEMPMISHIIVPIVKSVCATIIMLILIATFKKILKEIFPQPVVVEEVKEEEKKELEEPKEKIEAQKLAESEHIKALPIHEEVKQLAKKDPERIAYLTKLWLREAKEES